MRRYIALFSVMAIILSTSSCTPRQNTSNNTPENSTPSPDTSPIIEVSPKPTEYDDWGLSMELIFSTTGELELQFAHSSEASGVSGSLSTSPEYEIKIMHNGSPMDHGEYMRNVLGYDYAAPEFTWEAILYALTPDGVTSLLLSSIYGTLPAGIYILYKPVTLTTDDGVHISRTYTAQFAVLD